MRQTGDETDISTISRQDDDDGRKPGRKTWAARGGETRAARLARARLALQDAAIRLARAEKALERARADRRRPKGGA